jgi:Phytanoyl-CoA dioxygenase (PhyH)
MVTDRFGPIDFDDFHLVELPSLMARRQRIFTATDQRLVRPIAFRLKGGDSAYTYVPSGDRFAVVPGDDLADTIVSISYDDWCAFTWELKSCYALFYADLLSFPRGGFAALGRWEPALRVAYSGQPVYDLDDPEALTDRDGKQLDLSSSFTLDDPDAALSQFLEEAGFLHIRGVMTSRELESITAAVDAGVERARPDDKKSWWTSVGGRHVCNRVNYLNDQSELIAGLGADERFLRIGALGAEDLRDAADRLDGNSVVIKVPGAESGLADLPWHRDCGMGGHPVKCPMLNIGIQLDPATAGSGRLEMIAGSHRGTSRMPGPKEAQHLPIVPIDTQAGDVTVHFGHTLHAAPPPADVNAPGRRALYLTYVPPLTFEMIGPGQGYNDVLFTRADGHIKHVNDLTGTRP